MTRRDEAKPRRDSVAARAEASGCGRRFPACEHLTTAHNGDSGDEERRAAGYRDRARVEAHRAAYPFWYDGMVSEARLCREQGRPFSVLGYFAACRGFTIRNDMAPAYGRLLVAEHPELEGTIVMRAARCDVAFTKGDGESGRDESDGQLNG